MNKGRTSSGSSHTHVVTGHSVKDLMAVGSLDWVRNAAEEQLIPQFPTAWVWVRTVYPDRLVVEVDEYGALKLLEYSWTLEGDELRLGEPVEVSIEYTAKSAELTGPIVKADNAKRIVYAPVLVPDEPDSDGDVVTAEKIEEVAHLWLEKYRNIDIDHSLNNVAMPVESYIAPGAIDFPGGTVPKGSWMLAARVPEELWPQVVKGEWGGFSLMAVQASDSATAIKSGRVAAKRTTLADLGDDWVVPFVSIVDRPAVPKAKWVALKSEEQPDPDMWTRFKQLLTGQPPVEKAGRKFSDSTYSQLKAAAEALSALLSEAEKERSEKSIGASEKGNDMTPEQLQEAISGALKSELGPIIERLDALETTDSSSTQRPVDTSAESERAQTEKSESDELEALKSEIEALKAEKAATDEFRAKVEERLKASPKGLTGQDGDETPATKSAGFEEYTDVAGVRYIRDASGRARRVN